MRAKNTWCVICHTKGSGLADLLAQTLTFGPICQFGAVLYSSVACFLIILGAILASLWCFFVMKTGLEHQWGAKGRPRDERTK